MEVQFRAAVPLLDRQLLASQEGLCLNEFFKYNLVLLRGMYNIDMLRYIA